MGEESYRKNALFIFSVASFLTPFMASSVNIALPSIEKDLAMGAVMLSWIPTIYLFSAGVFLVPFGRIADIFGRRKIFIIGMCIYATASILISVSNSGNMLISLRALQGAGGSMIFGTGVAILISIFPPDKRGRVLGINSAAVYLGISTGPFIGGFLTQNFGWRSIFIINALLAMCIVFLVITKLKGEWAGVKGEKLDIKGCVMYSTSLVLMIYGFTNLLNIKGIFCFIIGLITTIFFIILERKTEYPVLQINLFIKNRVFAFSNLATLINYSASSIVSFLMSLYLQYMKSLSPQEAGLILISQPVVQAICSPVAGRLSDKIEPRAIASLGMAITVLALTLLSFVNHYTSLTLIIIELIVLGFGFGIFASPNTNAVMSSVENKFYGVASATLATMRILGQVFSMTIATMAISFYIGSQRIAPGTYDALVVVIRLVFSTCGVLCFLGIFASLARGKIRENLTILQIYTKGEIK